jgi:hypothetical protein
VTNFAFAAREKSLSFDEFQDILLNHEMLLNKVATPDVSNFVVCSKGSPSQFQLET